MRRRRDREPLEIRLTMRFNFGDTPEEAITVMDDRRVPLVGSVFESRDRIARGLVLIMLRTGLAQPKVAKELFPVLRLLRRPARKR
ncbi:MAG: hypothetical protein P4L83_23305 [Nevskia sp.]|nr:hypothetical protein [Nevskia sp.]